IQNAPSTFSPFGYFDIQRETIRILDNGVGMNESDAVDMFALHRENNGKRKKKTSRGVSGIGARISDGSRLSFSKSCRNYWTYGTEGIHWSHWNGRSHWSSGCTGSCWRTRSTRTCRIGGCGWCARSQRVKWTSGCGRASRACWSSGRSGTSRSTRPKRTCRNGY
ncbi:hypothetical protein EBX93_13865, partial [bacterium]|nr:hypothetical protein [bacterium]